MFEPDRPCFDTELDIVRDAAVTISETSDRSA
jgi:hypothetical protein